MCDAGNSRKGCAKNYEPEIMNRIAFFNQVRHSLFKGKLNNGHVHGIETILNEWENKAYKDIRWLAYMLATTFHETAATMQPIEEFGKGKGMPYGSKIKMNGKPYKLPDEIYYGRGFVQLTWYENYDNMGKILGINLLETPILALLPAIATKIMFEGMTRGSSCFGDFTGKSLEMYFNDKTDDPVNARKIINGTDKAELIAGYHYKFLNAIKNS